MNDLDKNIREILKHPLFHFLQAKKLIERFKDPAANSFKQILNGPKPSRPLRSAVNLARVIEMSRAVPEVRDLGQEALIALVKILKKEKKGPPWDIFLEGGRLSQTYSTSKILLGLGAEGINSLPDAVKSKAIKDITEHLHELLSLETEADPFLVITAARGLEACDSLPHDLREAVGVWANNFLYKTQATVESSSPAGFSATGFLLTLSAVGIYLPSVLSQVRLNSLLELLVKNFPILPIQAKTSITRVEGHAVACSSVDALILLLNSELLTQEMLKHIHYFKDTLDWLYDHSVEDEGTRFFYTDIFIDQHPKELWFNSAVLEFLVLLGERLQASEKVAIIEWFSGTNVPNAFSWDKLMIGGYKWPYLLKDRLLKPARDLTLYSMPLEQNGIILFGPPGTTKTSVAESMAKYVGWPIVTIAPGEFLANGTEGVFRRINEIFTRLVRLSKTIVLFDELELLILERNELTPKWESGLITDVMLPWFKKLHDWGRNIYVIATNNVEKIDKAIRRPKRFDFVLPLGPPSTEELKSFLQAKIPHFDEELVANTVAGRATIGEISQWASEVQFSKCNFKDAILLWKSHFGDKLQISESMMQDFKKKIASYCFPPGFA